MHLARHSNYGNKKKKKWNEIIWTAGLAAYFIILLGAVLSDSIVLFHLVQNALEQVAAIEWDEISEISVSPCNFTFSKKTRRRKNILQIEN